MIHPRLFEAIKINVSLSRDTQGYGTELLI